MKKLISMFTAVAATVVMSISAYAGQWQFDGPESWKWKYVNDDGSTTVNDWQQIDGKWYHFDADSYLDIGGWREIGQDTMYGNVYHWYYLDDSGVMAESGNTDTGYIGADGAFTTYYRNTTQAWSEDDENAYWLQKIAQYGYDNVVGVPASKDGVDCTLFSFPYDSESWKAPLDGQHITAMDYIEVAEALIGHTAPFMETWHGSWSTDNDAGVINYYVYSY